MITKNNTVAVLMGGVSREADISRKTGTAILQALLSLGYHAGRKLFLLHFMGNMGKMEQFKVYLS